MYSAVLQANELLFTEQDVTYCSIREGSSDKQITRVNCVHHGHTFVWDSHPTMICSYPSNIAIQHQSILSGARNAGVHDLKGMDGVWAGAIIADKAQARCSSYPGQCMIFRAILNLLFLKLNKERYRHWRRL